VALRYPVGARATRPRRPSRIIPGATPVSAPVALDATDDGTSTSAGALTVAYALAATDAGTSGETAAAAVAVALAATDAGTGTSTAAVQIAEALAATDAGRRYDDRRDRPGRAAAGRNGRRDEHERR
jgi:hypothetical protein